MTRETIIADVQKATASLLEMARDQTWNNISDNCVYILSEIEPNAAGNFIEARKLRKRNNKRKQPETLKAISAELDRLYDNLYDVNLHIYKALPEHTIIEVQYFPKSALEPDYREIVKDLAPMLHCKVAIPPYASDTKKPFDIHWELGGMRHQWKLFWWRKRMKQA